MKLFLTTALLLSALAIAVHAQTLSPAYPPPPPPAYAPPPQAYPPPPPPPAMAPPPVMAPAPGPSQSFNPGTLPGTSAAAPSFGPAPQQQGNVTFVSGGAGDEDRMALKQMSNSFNLHLLFAARSGEYLANINVTVADARGQAVLDTIAQGPIFYAKLPPGRYRVTVSNRGQSITREMSVPASGAASQDFYWSQV